ncbi:hypothetical protein VNO77_01043 [Canavalia gladiata]|uniref:Transmembrane 9 superfamily member n=1 Tax=Canavalia gladiata TaxID=3824 RepID=A0AAN9MR72_CANGL
MSNSPTWFQLFNDCAIYIPESPTSAVSSDKGDNKATSKMMALRLWRTIGFRDQKGWISVAWKAACFFCGIAILILTTLNFLLWGSHSTGAISFSLFVILILLSFCISVPLTLVGGYFGARAPHTKYPVRTNQISREIPQRRYPSWLLVLGAGTLPFHTMFLELFFIMSSIWIGRVYYVFGFLFIVLILLVMVCAEVSLVLTYMHLCVWRTGDGGGNHSLPPVLHGWVPLFILVRALPVLFSR